MKVYPEAYIWVRATNVNVAMFLCKIIIPSKVEALFVRMQVSAHPHLSIEPPASLASSLNNLWL